jgi:hypothetical protein
MQIFHPSSRLQKMHTRAVHQAGFGNLTTKLSNNPASLQT